MKLATFSPLLVATLALSLAPGCKKQAESDVSALITVTTTYGISRSDLEAFKGSTIQDRNRFKAEVAALQLEQEAKFGSLAKTNPALYYKKVGMLDWEDLKAKAAAGEMSGNATIEERAAIRMFTSDAYTEGNQRLRSHEAIKAGGALGMVYTLASALSKSETADCTSVRGLAMTSTTLADIQKTGRMEELGFMSTTLGRTLPVAFRNRPVTLVIHSKKCHLIKKLSMYPSENEILFPPGSDFTVSQVQTIGIKVIMHLEHVIDPTFKKITSGPKKNISRVLTGVRNNYPPLTQARVIPLTDLKLGLTAESTSDEEAVEYDEELNVPSQD
ncbi:MAG: hypothetical protein H7249_00180 [Chitinophagaceae bacterium]|nr:hypothetical protein [Oligoflexus sp.]